MQKYSVLWEASKKVSKNMKGILDHIIEGEDPRFKNLGIIVLDSIAVLNTPLEVAADIHGGPLDGD